LGPGRLCAEGKINFRGSGEAAGGLAAGDEDIAILQDAGGVAKARAVHSRSAGPSAGDRIIKFAGGSGRPATDAAGDEHLARQGGNPAWKLGSGVKFVRDEH